MGWGMARRVEVGRGKWVDMGRVKKGRKLWVLLPQPTGSTASFWHPLPSWTHKPRGWTRLCQILPRPDLSPIGPWMSLDQTDTAQASSPSSPLLHHPHVSLPYYLNHWFPSNQPLYTFHQFTCIYCKKKEKSFHYRMQLETGFLQEANPKELGTRETGNWWKNCFFFPACCHDGLRIVSPGTLFCSDSAIITSRIKIF